MNPRLFFSVGVLLMITNFCVAQIYDDLDTIISRSPNYYYSEWYDECPRFNTENADFYSVVYSCGSGKVIRENYTSKPIQMKGVVVFTDKVLNIYHSRNPFRAPEYAYAYQYDYSRPDSLLLIDSARWDTVMPKLIRFPSMADSLTNIDSLHYPRYFECYAYEAYFDKPITVDSTFFVGSSCNSNSITDEFGVDVYMKTDFFCICPVNSGTTGCCYLKYRKKYLSNDFILWDYMPFEPMDNFFGMFLPIVENHYLTVNSADEGMGYALGSGLFPDMSIDTIEAVPHTGYRFLQWNDGNTNNPRVICLTCDTSFTAFFTVDTVPGGGVGMTVAEALQFSLSPNPTHDAVTIAIVEGGSPDCRASIVDASGRILLTRDFTGATATIDISALPAGRYFVTLTSADGRHGRRALVKD